MKKPLFTIILTFLLSAKLLFAGDTIRVMQYNLLYYDMITSFCTESNNNLNQKNINLNKIIEHYKPDIFTVNELNGSPNSVSILLNNALNVDGVTRYQSATFTGSYLINMLYYNTDKLVLKHQSYIQTSPRQTDVYTLYHKSSNLINGDTTFLTCIVSHLKAGNGSQDASTRATSALQIMNYIKNRNLQGNIMLMGDFNVYSPEELAFQRFLAQTSTGIRFYDPADAIGEWHDNPLYSNYHTQSTHISGDCFSGGGMDDRFDFILTSKSLLDGTKGAKYVEDSYWAYGQDGNRFNGTLISPINYSLPSNIINALFNMSDHLPVTLKINVDYDLYANDNSSAFVQPTIKVVNPVVNTIDFWIDGILPQTASVSIFNSLGAFVMKDTLSVSSGNKYSLNANRLVPGIYIMQIKGNNFQKVLRITKQ
ncbi:MAG: T9SS type A sorting domain-containing protein [Bacteroidales bacterium]|jgi:hypothetical protein|nr:T9SS type A sorting domain-containing protein [Bacteroidales bacterium]MDD4384947.1 T9SS type A sorting domain-containing protein [Bacteroidales bacterium]MDY0197026.1 T9SS type A sorting domain-containing protein [Tenuifilaceae bacterium]